MTVFGHRWALACTLCLVITGVLGQPTPEGIWQTYDDQHTRVQAWVRIEKRGDYWVGTVDRVLDPDASPDEKCNACRGDKKGLPMTGLTIIEGIPIKSGPPVWSGGKILDPESGDEYRLEFELQNQARTLVVKGYWGPFWRTQRWIRLVSP